MRKQLKTVIAKITAPSHGRKKALSGWTKQFIDSSLSFWQKVQYQFSITETEYNTEPPVCKH
ncbi:MAG: hypothetical protein IKU70_09200 [Clostridia bacterium]|nr:hypothetical protein [Clostridia bacterium]